MNTKTIALVIVFAAVAIVLNLSPLKLPAPYAPFLIYQIWEIPIVVAFLLYGARVGILITVINTLVLLALYPGALPTGPFYNLAAVLSMLLGIGTVKLAMGKYSIGNGKAFASLSTASGILFRTALMTVMNYALLRVAPPVGYSMPEEAIIATIPLVAVFNATLALYTIPAGHFLAKAVGSYTKT